MPCLGMFCDVDHGERGRLFLLSRRLVRVNVEDSHSRAAQVAS